MKSHGKSKKPVSKTVGQAFRKQSESVLHPPPPKLPEEVENLFSINDFTELEYRNIGKMRQHKVKTPEVSKKIAEHDVIEKRIAEAPEDLLREAHEAIDHGTSILLKLVRSKKMLHTVMPSIKGRATGVEPYTWDGAFECLDSRIDYSNRQLIRLAEIGIPKARRNLFYQAKTLASAFIRLAQAFPKDFRDAAESSLTMPSLRARTPTYSADAQVIAKNIHLGEKHLASNITDNRDRLGALCHVLIAEFVDHVGWERKVYQYEKESFERLKVFKKTAKKYATISFEEWLQSQYHPTKLEGLLISSKLPELNENPEAWWRQRILPMVKNKFVIISKQPIHNAALWETLKAKTPKDTLAAMMRIMEKNCRNKFFRIAKACP